ncbi:MAG: hypothetical protein GOMPHAMPRED_001034 [Gomphillus americanus]|uniref:Phenol 2-monooxygenase n=1 Tax=Gomphillus americanus TaxID=1940652 RepID=A0A8H3F2T6_9LECA|nr:MAG: hypothetical protein GOMPHAMPRED_001034 [Gomphillus americanus]
MADNHTDVVVVGAGPAGLMVSLYLSELGVKHRIIDQLGTRALNGRADGFQVRTVEIWDSFDIATRIQSHGSHFGEWALWTPGEEGIARTSREAVFGEDSSRLSTATFHQGYIEAALIEGAQKRGGPLVERGVKFASVTIDPDTSNSSAYPIHLSVQHLREDELEKWGVNAHRKLEDGSLEPADADIEAFGTDPENIRWNGNQNTKQGTIETIHAKYVIGADGGHSAIRRQLGFKMDGANSDSVWGVIDIIPITDFPDIRRLCTILSKHGNILVIPREKGLIRIYVQLPDENPTTGPSSISLNNPNAPIEIFKTIQQIFRPYVIDYKVCDWWTVYKVGQRVSDHFSFNNQVFLIGDAVHTHTPKGGQGSNVSQQDAYNLAWKLAGVLHGQIKPSALSTFESERLPIARDLITLDTNLSRVLSTRSGVDMKDVKDVYARLKFFGSNVAFQYAPSSIVATQSNNDQVASKVIHGTRLSNAYVYNLSSSNRIASQALLKSTGSWYLFVLAGNLLHQPQLSLVNHTGTQLESLSKKYPHISARRPQDPFLRVLLFAANKLSDFVAKDLHSAFFPNHSNHGRDYDTIFGDQQADGSDALKPEYSRNLDGVHQVYGVDKEKGGMILVRPDQIVAWTGRLSDTDNLERFFAGVLGSGTDKSIVST